MQTPHPLPHFDDQGASRMVDVGGKASTRRYARATGQILLQPETLEQVRSNSLAKGDVLEVARLAGILAAKRTWEWIPLCHPLAMEGIEIQFAFPQPDRIAICAETRITGKTGVEMEALVAVAAAALTIYDMCKAMDRQMVIDQIRLEEKSGGQSGHFRRSSDSATPGESKDRPERNQDAS